MQSRLYENEIGPGALQSGIQKTKKSGENIADELRLFWRKAKKALPGINSSKYN